MNKNIVVAQIAITTVVSLALSATPALAAYGSSPSNSETCTNEAPGKPTFSFVRASGASEIEIGWNATDKATKWSIAYGKEPGKYIYGASDFGDENSRSTKIALLPTGVYYVAVKASNGCMPGPFSAERRMTVFASGQVLGAKTAIPFLGNVLGAKDNPSPTPSASPVVSASPTSTSTPTPEVPAVKLNWFQRLFQFLFGK